MGVGGKKLREKSCVSPRAGFDVDIHILKNTGNLRKNPTAVPPAMCACLCGIILSQFQCFWAGSFTINLYIEQLRGR